MDSDRRTISIVLPTRNGMATLPAVLDSIAAQKIEAAVEMVAVDTSSTDGSFALLEDRCDRVISIEKEDFDHGLSRNLGIESSRGELVVLLVQDAEPVDELWLHHLTQPLFADEGLAATWCRQISRPGASALTRHYHGTWQGSSLEDRESKLDDRAAFLGLAPLERLEICTLDNVCSCLRRSVWLDHAFASTPIAEDLEWARAVLLAGHRIRFTGESAVLHSHERSAGHELRRTIEVHRRLGELFGVRTVPDLLSLTRGVLSNLPLHLRCLANEPSWADRVFRSPRYLALAIAWPLGQYLGGRSGGDFDRALPGND